MHTVTVFSHRTQRIDFYRADAFQFRKDRPLKWLQRLCVWVLRKLSCFYLDSDYKTSRIEISQDDVIHCARKQIYEMISRGRSPRVIYLGHDKMMELHAQVHADDFLKFNVTNRYCVNGEMKIMDIPVEVIPYMDGVLVV